MLQGATIDTKDVVPIAAAVQNIVQMAFNKSSLLDFCQVGIPFIPPAAD